jgi:membrane protein implicated in regulation of membrane protease activity
MKNFILSVILTIILAFALQHLLPWWIVAIITFAVAYLIDQNSLVSFLSGFVSIFLLWVGYAWFLSSANNDILLGKVTVLLNALTQGSKTNLYLITGLIGGLAGGFGALTGSLARKISD